MICRLFVLDQLNLPLTFLSGSETWTICSLIGRGISIDMKERMPFDLFALLTSLTLTRKPSRNCGAHRSKTGCNTITTALRQVKIAPCRIRLTVLASAF